MGNGGEARTIRAFDAADQDLDHVLGMTATLLLNQGDKETASLLSETSLTFERDGGYFNPIEGDNWTADTYQAVLHIPRSSYRFDKHVRNRIWSVMESVLQRYDCPEVQELSFREQLEPLPTVEPDWRAANARQRPTNHARRARQTHTTDAPTYKGLSFDSRAEIAVFKMLETLQQNLDQRSTIAITPLPAVQLRDADRPLSPDILVIGNGRAAIVEVDGPHHRARTRRVDDDDRNRHWTRCGVESVRVSVENIDAHPGQVERVLREDLSRVLGIPDPPKH